MASYRNSLRSLQFWLDGTDHLRGILFEAIGILFEAEELRATVRKNARGATPRHNPEDYDQLCGILCIFFLFSYSHIITRASVFGLANV